VACTVRHVAVFGRAGSSSHSDVRETASSTVHQLDIQIYCYSSVEFWTRNHTDQAILSTAQHHRRVVCTSPRLNPDHRSNS